MEEFAPFVGVSCLVVGVGKLLDAVGLGSRGAVDELENEGSTGDDARASRQTGKTGLLVVVHTPGSM